MKLLNNSQKEWLALGGTEEALHFIDNVIDNLHTKALNEGIVFKEATEDVETTEEVTEQETQPTGTLTDAEIQARLSETTQEPEPETEVQNQTTAEETTNAVDMKSFEKQFATTMMQVFVEAQKEYHRTVVEPLIKELNELKQATAKQATHGSMFGWDTMTNLLPPAAVATEIRKAFGSSDDTVVGNPVTGTPISEKVATPSTNSGNLLSGF